MEIFIQNRPMQLGILWLFLRSQTPAHRANNARGHVTQIILKTILCVFPVQILPCKWDAVGTKRFKAGAVLAIFLNFEFHTP
jgi:hypothetical protein